MQFIIALLLCLGDNCDLVRVEPTLSYPSYEACSQATSEKASELGKFIANRREPGRESELLCVRYISQIAELDEEREALADADVHEAPNGNARTIGTVARGNTVHVTGAIDNWLRIKLPNNGGDGFIIGERLRKVSLDEINARRIVRTQPPAAPAPAQQAVVAPAPPAPAAKEFRDCAQCPVMVRIPGGTFEMGSSNDPSERPLRRVTIAAFAIGKFEVTQAEWSACVAAGACSYKGTPADDRLPMRNLSWQDASEFVLWLSKTTGKPYRLPSEAEWEYAVRAGTTTNFPWGPQIGVNKADCNGCGTQDYVSNAPLPSGSYQQNAWGLFDMLGSVAEWTDDCWHKDYTGAPPTGAAWQTPRCQARVLRGGSWKNPPKDLTVSARNFYDANVRYSSNGMRVTVAAN